MKTDCFLHLTDHSTALNHSVDKESMRFLAAAICGEVPDLLSLFLPSSSLDASYLRGHTVSSITLRLINLVKGEDRGDRLRLVYIQNWSSLCWPSLSSK